MKPILNIENLTKVYGALPNQTRALNGITFQGMERAAIQTSQGFYQSAPESHAPLLKDTPASFEAQNG